MGEKKPMLSVIMPVHNSERWLAQSINSILSQSYRQFELICVDDASEDSSGDILRGYAKADERISYQSVPGLGAAGARNYGLSLASGKYVLFLDSDDIFSPIMFEQMVRCLEQTNADACICESTRFNQRTQNVETHYVFPESYKQGLYNHDDLGRELFQIGCQVPWNKMVKRELITTRGILFPDIPNNEDALFSASVMLYARSIFILRKPLIKYRWGTGSSIQDHEGSKPDGALLAAETINSKLQGEVSSDDEKESLFEYCLLLAITTLKVASSAGKYTQKLHDRIASDLALWNARVYKASVRSKLRIYLPLCLLLDADYRTISWVYAKRIERRETRSTLLEKIRLAGRLLVGITYSRLSRIKTGQS